VTTLLLSGAAVIADGSFGSVPDCSDILIQNDRIAAVQPAGTITQADRTIDAGALIAASGLINGHLHSWDHFIKGRVENLPMEMMMAHLRPAVPLPLTERDIYLRTMMTAIESLRTGATTIVDDMSLGQGFDRTHVDAALQAYQDAGIRTYLGFSMIDKPVVDSWPFVEESFAPDVLAWLRALPAPEDAVPADELRKLIGYVADNEHRTDYPAYRAQGWDLGSGPTEAACKVVGARFKQSGMRWVPPGAATVAPLRALYLSGTDAWDTYWAMAL